MEKKIEITDEFMRQTLATGKQYLLVIYKKGRDTDFSREEADKIQWDHLRYLFGLRAEGKLLLNGPVSDNPQFTAIGIFNSTDKEEVTRWMDKDPLIKVGKRSYELYPYFGIPGDRLS